MGQQVVLNAEIRDKSGKGYSRRLRSQGMVPAVLYGQ
ncbi:MAG TPA: 50S ribosomal protein L25, partial [Thermoanaerobacterales bacterium]|nr:50S ribosomal protein L25 [Thermoanaerobacterales bacterium]